MKKITTTTTNVEKLISDVNTKELTKVNLNDEQLLSKIIENYSSVQTKSAMLKLIRKDNFKVSQDRCYNMYLRYEKSIKEDTKEEV